MLVVTAVLCVLLGWKVRQVERQKEAIAWVKEVGGRVTYAYESYENDEHGSLVLNGELPGPDWLCQLIGVDYFASVAEVSLADGVIHDLSPLYELEKLRTLVLWEPLVQVPDEEIAAFEKALPDCEIFYPCFEYFDEESERNFDRADKGH